MFNALVDRPPSSNPSPARINICALTTRHTLRGIIIALHQLKSTLQSKKKTNYHSQNELRMKIRFTDRCRTRTRVLTFLIEISHFTTELNDLITIIVLELITVPLTKLILRLVHTTSVFFHGNSAC